MLRQLDDECFCLLCISVPLVQQVGWPCRGYSVLGLRALSWLAKTTASSPRLQAHVLSTLMTSALSAKMKVGTGSPSNANNK